MECVELAQATLPIFDIALLCGGLLLMGVIIYRELSRRTKPKTFKDADEKRFLEEALDDDPVRVSQGRYTWEELQRDLHDGKLTFDEIWEKAGGVFPERPKEAERQAEASLEGPDRNSRAAWLQAWFQVRSAEQGLLKVVPPPPPAPVTVNMKGQTVKCSACSGSGRHSVEGIRFPTSWGQGWTQHAPPPRPDGLCASCGGKGFVVITSG